jgi:hopanoid-associated phosphorylase
VSSTVPHRIVAVTCLAFEASIARGHGVTVLCNAQRPGLREEIREALAGAAGVISFGVAGGLDPRLRPGDWVVASSVRAPSSVMRADEHWTRHLCEALPGAVRAEVCGVDHPVPVAAAKAALGRAHAAAAVDTESHVVAEEAMRAGVPFAAARVILDPVWRSLPAAALVPLRADGAPDVRAVARSVLRAPRQLGGLGLITLDAWRALDSLRRGRARLGAGLAFPTVEPAVEMYAPGPQGEPAELADECAVAV